MEEELEWEVEVPVSGWRGSIVLVHGSGPTHVKGGAAILSKEDSPVCTSGEGGVSNMCQEECPDGVSGEETSARILEKEVTSKRSEGEGRKSVLTCATFHWSGVPKMAVEQILPD